MTDHKQFKRWVISQTRGIDGLKFVEDASIEKVGDEQVLVELHAASLNYRDVMIVKGGHPGMVDLSTEAGRVPGCDGAGIVRAVGTAVKSFQPGDRVVTHIIAHNHDDGKINFTGLNYPLLGHDANGTLTQYGLFHTSNLVRAPKNLSFEEAATTTCSGLTAYNALFGLGGRHVEKGHWVLVQGTGGVSIAALQIAVAVGANVIATTSNAERADKLRKLGAREVINYHETPEWGAPARAFTPDNAGFDHVVDVGGDTTLAQSIAAVKIDGVVTLIGIVGGAAEKQVPMMLASPTACIVRGLCAGTRNQFREYVRFVEGTGLRPALDDVSFGMEDVQEAFRRAERQQHFSKVIIKLQE